MFVCIVKLRLQPIASHTRQARPAFVGLFNLAVDTCGSCTPGPARGSGRWSIISRMTSSRARMSSSGTPTVEVDDRSSSIRFRHARRRIFFFWSSISSLSCLYSFSCILSWKKHHAFQKKKRKILLLICLELIISENR